MLIIKSEKQIQNIRVAGSIIKHCFVFLQDFLKKNTDGTLSTLQIDKIIHEIIVKEGGEPAFLGHEGFPAVSCISINEEIIHGIPKSNAFIQKNDLISIDIGVKFQGYYADSAYTFYYGKDEKILRFLKLTRKALQLGIQAIKRKSSILDIARAIETCAREDNLGIVKEYCGHGVGVQLHESPEIPNYYHHAYHKKLRKNMVIAIEPMFTLGTGEIRMGDDATTVLSKDNTLAAHYEHTVLVCENGAEILT